MLNSVFVAIALVQSPVEDVSPLEIELRALVAAPAEVRHEFIDQVIVDWNMPLWRYVRYSASQQSMMAERAYYIQAVGKAMLVHQNDRALTDIINELDTPNPDMRGIAIKFDREFKRRYGRWAPIVPVDVQALTRRMLRGRTVR